MTKSTITRERLEKIKSWRETYGAGSNVMLPAEEAEGLASMALAAMGSESVGEVLSNRPGNDTSTIDRALPVGTQLYRHAQQPVVPDAAAAIRACLSEFPEGVRDIVEECADIAENACRASILQTGNSPEQGGSRCSIKAAPALDSSPKTAESRCGNSPVIPEGYVMVPNEPSKEMAAAFFYQKNRALTGLNFVCSDEDFGKIYEAMLAAAPQEVKGE